MNYKYNQFVDKIMCSKIFPCPLYLQEEFQNLNNNDLRKYNRTWKLNYLELLQEQNEDSYVPMKFTDN